MEGNQQESEQNLRREVFERNDIYGAAVTRRLISERLKHPSEKESKDTIALITSEFFNPALQAYTNVDILKKYKKIASEKYGFPLSPPFLSISVIRSIAMELNGEATQEFKNTSLLSSIPIEIACAYDMSIGIMKVLSTIQDAEYVLRRTYDKKIGVFYDEWSEVISPLVQAESFLAQKAKALEYATLLKEDPTGKSLIRHAVEEIEDPKEEFYPSLREFVVHGARLAESAYGIVYPLAEKIIKPT